MELTRKMTYAKVYETEEQAQSGRAIYLRGLRARERGNRAVYVTYSMYGWLVTIEYASGTVAFIAH